MRGREPQPLADRMAVGVVEELRPHAQVGRPVGGIFVYLRQLNDCEGHAPLNSRTLRKRPNPSVTWCLTAKRDKPLYRIPFYNPAPTLDANRVCECASQINEDAAMRISCLQENLARGLNIVSRAVAPRTATLPVLTHVLLASDNGRLKIAATNLELGVSCWIGAKVEDEGAITVPARTFTDLVALLPADKVDLDLNIRTQSLRVQSGRTDANIKGIDAQEFPIIPTFNADAAAFVDPAVLKKMIAQVVFAAATDESRPTLTGVLTKLDGDKITMAATDGFRLSVRSGQLKEPVGEPRTILIPARALAEVARVMGDQEEPVALSVTPSHGQVLFHLNNVDVVAQLIDQKFPDYEPIIPKKHDTRTIVNTADVLKACRQAGIFARDSLDTVRMVIKPGEELEPGKITVTARADETGDNQSEMEASVNGGEIEIGFNVKYLIDALSSVDTPQVAFETTQPRSAAVMRAIGDDNFFHLVMPMHLPRS